MLGLIVLGMVLLTIGGGFWWYYNDGDLDEVQQHAKEHGLPTTWAKLRGTVSDENRIRIWERITKVGSALGSYQDSESFRPRSVQFSIWDPPSQALLDHHASLDAGQVKELASLLDQLGDEPLILHEVMTYRTLLPETGVKRDLIRFMQERLLIADKTDVGDWARRMLACCRSISPDSLMLNLVRISLIEITLTGIAKRMPDLKLEYPKISQDILKTIGDPHHNTVRSLHGEYLMMFETLSQNRAHTEYGEAKGTWFMPVILRAGRAPVLIGYLDDVQHFQLLDPNTAVTWGAGKDADLQAARSGRITPQLFIRGIYQPAWHALARNNVSIGMHGRLIAAEMLGKPWPIDGFDPTGAVLRPIMRDGRVIAAYSVGTDGIDQSGADKLDRIFPLYAKP